MRKVSAGFDLRMSANWSLGLIAFAALWLMVSGGEAMDSLLFARAQLLGAYLVCLLVALLLVLVVWPPAGRWLLVLGTSAFVVFAHRYLGLPGTLSLLMLSVGMAVAFISVSAGAVTAVAQTVTLLALRRAGLAAGGEISSPHSPPGRHWQYLAGSTILSTSSRPGRGPNTRSRRPRWKRPAAGVSMLSIVCRSCGVPIGSSPWRTSAWLRSGQSLMTRAAARPPS